MDLEIGNEFVGVLRGIRFVKADTNLCVLSQPSYSYYTLPSASDEAEDKNIDFKPQIILFNWLNPAKVTRIEIDMRYVYGFAISPTGNLVAVYGEKGVDVIDLTTEKNITSFREMSLFCASFFDERTLLLVQSGEKVLTLDIESGTMYQVFDELENVNSIFQHSASSTIVFSMGFEAGGLLLFVDLPNPQSIASEVGSMDFVAEGVEAIFSPDGQYLAAVDWSVRLYNFPELELLAAFDLSGQPFDIAPYDETDTYYSPYPARPLGWSKPVFSPDSSSLICHSPNGRIFEWDLVKLQLKNEWQGNENGCHYLDISSDGKWLVMTGGSGNVKVLDISGE